MPGNNEMRTLVVGERFNQSPLRLESTRQRLANDGHEFGPRHVDVMLRLGAFHTPMSRRNLDACGVEWTDGLNLCWPGRTGDQWDAYYARRVAEAVTECLLEQYDLFVLCGSRVHAAFGLGDLAVPQLVRDGRFLLTPHPSGLCRAWNHAACREMVTELYREARELYG